MDVIEESDPGGHRTPVRTLDVSGHLLGSTLGRTGLLSSSHRRHSHNIPIIHVQESVKKSMVDKHT